MRQVLDVGAIPVVNILVPRQLICDMRQVLDVGAMPVVVILVSGQLIGDMQHCDRY